MESHSSIRFIVHSMDLEDAFGGWHRSVSNKSKPRNDLAVEFDGFQEHLLRSNPKSMLAVLLSVHNEFFVCLAVPSHAKDRVFVAFVVAIASRLGFSHVSLIV